MFEQSLCFIEELEKLKKIERMNLVLGGERRENSAEPTSFAVPPPSLRELSLRLSSSCAPRAHEGLRGIQGECHGPPRGSCAPSCARSFAPARAGFSGMAFVLRSWVSRGVVATATRQGSL